MLPASPRAGERPQRPRRRFRSPVPLALVFALLVGVVGTAGVLRAADARGSSVTRIDGLRGVLASDEDFGPSVNYLLVGSDSREGVDADTPNYGAIGDTSDVSGQRSDTIMILRREQDGGLALTSIPRDLWVEIAGTGRSNRVNSAYNGGPEQLAATVTGALGIPIHHYVEVDFIGFKEIINTTGGVPMCIEYATRDQHSGLSLQPGCQDLDGTQALAFARSRYFEEFRDGQWRMDPTADLGRIRRQQLFIRSAMNGALEQWRASPFSSGALLDSVIGSVRVDPDLDVFRAAESLRRAAQEEIATYVLPVVGTTIDGKAVLLLDDGADEILDYFRGIGPAPEPEPLPEGSLIG